MADHAPIKLDDLKEDLGITDASQDAWLQRRVDGIWSRIEQYTARKLRAPPEAFVDDWGLIAEVDVNQPQPLWYMARASVFLRYFPVASIEAIEMDSGAGTASDVRFDGKTGKLFNLSPGGMFAQDVSTWLVRSRVKITYKAGWDAVPGDLYEVVLGAMSMLWPQRRSQASGGLGGTPKLINIADVGSVDLDTGGNLFIESAAAKPGVAGGDPLLGPYASMLDGYVDHRSLIGWAMQPVTTAVEPEPPPP